MGKSFSLATDKYSERKGILVLVFFISTIILVFNLIVVPQYTTYAISYLVFAFIFFGAYLYDKVTKKEIVDVLAEEEPKKRLPLFNTITGWKFWAFIGILFLWKFLAASGAGAFLIEAPTFQAADFASTTEYSSFMSGLVGFQETFFFFSFIFITTVGIIFRRFIQFELVAVIIGAIITSIIFAVFHWKVYGLENLLATQAVFYYGLYQCGLMYALRSSTVLIADHFANNFFVTWFSQN